MAEAVARVLLGDDVRIESAGISAENGASATEDAIRVMQERGIDISGHRSRSVSGLNLLDFDLVVALTPSIAQDLRNRGVDETKLTALDIRDPYGEGLAAYRITILALERDLRSLFDVRQSNVSVEHNC